MNSSSELHHGKKTGTQKYCGQCNKWGTSSNWARHLNRCKGSSPSQNTQQSSSLESSSLVTTEQPPSGSLINSTTEQRPLRSVINSTTEQHEAYRNIHDYLLSKFTEDYYKEEDDNIAYCPSLDDAKKIFGKCKVHKLTGCWTYDETADHHRTVARWKCDRNQIFRFYTQTGGYIPQDQKSLYVRHHPLRCELVRTTPSEHITCCRPSHLAWGTAEMNKSDQRLRECVEKHPEYKIIAQNYTDEVDKLAKKLDYGLLISSNGTLDKGCSVNTTINVSNSENSENGVDYSYTGDNLVQSDIDNPMTKHSSEEQLYSKIKKESPVTNPNAIQDKHTNQDAVEHCSSRSPETTDTNDDKKRNDDKKVDGSEDK